jgi:sugar phosphate isomerase/epimerase
LKGFWPDDLDEKTAYRNLVNNLRWASEITSQRGIKLALEHDQRLFPALREEVGKELFINVDPSGFGLDGEDPVTAIRRFSPFIGGVHLKDARFQGAIKEEVQLWMESIFKDVNGKKEKIAYRGTKPEFTPMGKGDVDFKKVIDSLENSDYKGYLNVEYEGNYSGYTRDPVKASKDSYDYLAKIMK